MSPSDPPDVNVNTKAARDLRKLAEITPSMNSITQRLHESSCQVCHEGLQPVVSFRYHIWDFKTQAPKMIEFGVCLRCLVEGVLKLTRSPNFVVMKKVEDFLMQSSVRNPRYPSNFFQVFKLGEYITQSQTDHVQHDHH